MWLSINIEPETKKNDIINSFQRKSTIVADLYNKLLADHKLKFTGVKKISISITSIQGVDFVGGPIKGISPVASIRKTYDFDKLELYSEDQIKLEILKLIQNSITELGEKFSWDTGPFDPLYNNIVESNFNHVYFEMPFKLSKDKFTRAGVKVEMHENYAEISMVFTKESDDNFLILPLIKTHPNRIFISQIIGKGKWLSNDEFLVSDKLGETHFKGMISKKRIDLSFTPKTKSEDQLIDDLLISSPSSSSELIQNLLNKRIDDILE